MGAAGCAKTNRYNKSAERILQEFEWFYCKKG